MSPSPRSVSWPKDLKEDVITLIELLFSLLDSKDALVGSHLAHDVFTKDGKFFSSDGYFQGQDIAVSRANVWENFEIRRHELHKVFVNGTDSLDLLLVGIAFVKPHGKEQIIVEFIARAIVQSTLKGPRIKYYQSLLPNPSNQPILADVEL